MEGKMEYYRKSIFTPFKGKVLAGREQLPLRCSGFGWLQVIRALEQTGGQEKGILVHDDL